MQKKKFNFHAKKVYLTYPRCSLSKEVLIEELGKISEIKNYAVSIERHADGTPHLHALIEFYEKIHRTTERAFDIQGHHPNIKGVKTNSDQSRILDYVAKDGDYLSTFPRKLSRRDVAKKILSEGLVKTILDDHPEIIFQNFSNIQRWLQFSQIPSRPKVPDNKRRHTWLHGPSNSGKSYWLRGIQQLYDCVEIPQNNDWNALAFRPNVEVIYCDEYRGNLTVQELNRLCDGNTQLNTKGGSVYIQPCWIIIVSNFSIGEVYNKCSIDILDTLYNRFIQYDSSISMPPLPKYII